MAANDEETETFDQRVGRHLLEVRKARGLSQVELSSRLESERGLKLAQQTIAKVEAGSRPLRLQEAEDMAAVLDVPLDSVVSEDWPSFDSRLRLLNANTLVNNARERLGEAVRDFRGAQMHLSFCLDRADRPDVHIEDGLMNESYNQLVETADALVQSNWWLQEMEERQEYELVEKFGHEYLAYPRIEARTTAEWIEAKDNGEHQEAD